MWDFILKDLFESVMQHLFYGLIISFFVTAGVMILCRAAGISKTKRDILMFYLLVTYIICILQIALFSREPGSRDGIDMELFSTWRDSPMARAYVIENIIMYLPFGYFFMYFSKNTFSIVTCVLAAGTSSLTIEIVQLITERGYFQLDDIVMNTVGAIAGIILYYVLRRIGKILF